MTHIKLFEDFYDEWIYTNAENHIVMPIVN
jgi:hypothetical protein